MVYEGTFQNRPVAVKRLLSHFTTLASHEVSLLQSTDFHPNIVRYFYEEQRDPWLYIALELCPASLADLIDRPAEFPDLVKLFDPQAALRGVVQGVRHLHELKVCHRDIKPGNILVSKTHSNSLKMLISDFGLAKRVPVDQSSYGATLATPSSTTMMPSGTPGWRAPEVLRRPHPG
jgi:serine/threonine-protein kinase/endoribonuclease IRE1